VADLRMTRIGFAYTAMAVALVKIFRASGITLESASVIV
jgi:hypothetical protein